MADRFSESRALRLRDLRQPIAVISVAIILLVLWQTLRFMLNLPAYKLPDPLSILTGFFDATPRGVPVFLSLAYDLLITWSEAIVGFAMGVVAGIAFAVLFVRFNALERGLLPYLIASQTVPILAVAPLVVVGIGQVGAPPLIAKAIVAAYLTFFAVTVNVLRGFKSVNEDALALMRSYAASDRSVYLKLRFPASLPYLFTALKISATASVIGAIVAELPVGSSEGLGSAIINGAQYNTFQPAYLWATIIAAAILGLLFYGVIALAERRVVVWRTGE